VNPFFFGRHERRLFGIYEAGNRREGPARGAVLCHPWGSEYMHAHRTVRQAALKLAAAGIDTLRFDYFGTGDSAGEMQHANVDLWADDICAAIDEIVEMSGARRVTLVGLRFGALLAARVAAERPSLVERLVLWDPILDGRSYLEELFATCRAQVLPYRDLTPRPASAGGGFEVLGYPVSERMMRDFQALDVRAFAADLPAPTDVLVSGSDGDVARVREALAPAAASASIEQIEQEPCWIEYWPPRARSIQPELLERLVERTKAIGAERG
jgi:exosortase A-associated hydrolase 2